MLTTNICYLLANVTVCQCFSSYHELHSYSIWMRIFSLFFFDINALAEISK